MKLSIRTKLTLWYTLILVVTLLVYVISTNAIAQHQYRRDPGDVFRQIRQEHPEAFSEPGSSVPQSGLQPDEIREYIDQIRKEDLRTVRIASFSIFTVLTLLSFAGGYIISGRMLRPLQRVNEATKKLDANNLHISIEGVNTKDELGELITNFNSMTKRLYHSFDLQKQFIENASHELKTPLTISQTNLEAVLQDTHMSEQELEENVRNAINSIGFMNNLIEDLLLLSITKEQIPMEDISVEEVIRAAVTQLQPIAHSAHKTIKFSAHVQDSTTHSQGNKTLLQRAVMNCVENAIRYAHARIRVELIQQTDKIELRIHDDGPGIPKAEQQNVWERFYRIDSSRSRKDGGTGLGMAITKAIIELHEGTVAIDSTPETGTTIILRL